MAEWTSGVMCLAELDPEQADKLKAILRLAAKPENSDELEPKLQDALEKIRQVLGETIICLQIADLKDISDYSQKKEVKSLANHIYNLVDKLDNLTSSQHIAYQSIGMKFLLHTGVDLDEMPKHLKSIAENLYEYCEELDRNYPTTEGYCLNMTVSKLGQIYHEFTGKIPGYSQRKKYVDTEENVVTRDDRFEGPFVELVETCFALIGIKKSNLAIGQIIKNARVRGMAQ